MPPEQLQNENFDKQPVKESPEQPQGSHSQRGSSTQERGRRSMSSQRSSTRRQREGGTPEPNRPDGSRKNSQKGENEPPDGRKSATSRRLSIQADTGLNDTRRPVSPRRYSAPSETGPQDERKLTSARTYSMPNSLDGKQPVATETPANIQKKESLTKPKRPSAESLRTPKSSIKADDKPSMSTRRTSAKADFAMVEERKSFTSRRTSMQVDNEVFDDPKTPGSRRTSRQEGADMPLRSESFHSPDPVSVTSLPQIISTPQLENPAPYDTQEGEHSPTLRRPSSGPAGSRKQSLQNGAKSPLATSSPKPGSSPKGSPTPSIRAPGLSAIPLLQLKNDKDFTLQVPTPIPSRRGSVSSPHQRSSLQGNLKFEEKDSIQNVDDEHSGLASDMPSNLSVDNIRESVTASTIGLHTGASPQSEPTKRPSQTSSRMLDQGLMTLDQLLEAAADIPESSLPESSQGASKDSDKDSGNYMTKAFKLCVAGICDANNKDYFPLQEKIALLESRLIDMASQHSKLLDEHRLMQLSHRPLDESLRAVELVARDQVVFENLKMNYNLVSSELEEARQLIRELREFGWENLSQRLLSECLRAHDHVDRMTKERDVALHEHSAARNIANEALKQVKVLQRALEDHKQLSERLLKREHQVKEVYHDALAQLNDEWQEKLLFRHNRDKRRQQHIAFLLEEQRDARSNYITHKDLDNIMFRANMVYHYPTLADCAQDITHFEGGSLEQSHDATSDEVWQIASKVLKSSSDNILSLANRSVSDVKTKKRPQSMPKVDDMVQLKELWHHDVLSENEDGPTDLKRQTWLQFRAQLRTKYDEKCAENQRLQMRVNELEEQIRNSGTRHMNELQLVQKVDELNRENDLLVEHYLSEMALRKKFLNDLEDLRGKIRVYCRLRRECDKSSEQVVFAADDYTVLVKVPSGVRSFFFNRVFHQDAGQEEVFDELRNLVQSAVDGYNVTVLSYGENGSGKTYTLSGQHERVGLVSRVFRQLFNIFDNPDYAIRFHWKVSMMMFDLTSDGRCLDLLSDQTAAKETTLSRDGRGHVVVEGVSKRSIGCCNEMHELFYIGLHKHRAADMQIHNIQRSHMIVIVQLMITNKLTRTTTFGRITFVKLGDSEKVTNPTTASLGEENKEFHKTNESLAALGDVITSLALEQSVIPYESSKLTMLLQDALGGNSKTIMLAHVFCTEKHLHETLNTLNYSSRLRSVTNRAVSVNNNEQVMRLRMVTEQLKHGEPVPC